MTDQRNEIEAEATRIVDQWRDIDDPVAKLEALSKRGGPEMKAFFAMMGSELAMAMSDDPL